VPINIGYDIFKQCLVIVGAVYIHIPRFLSRQGKKYVFFTLAVYWHKSFIVDSKIQFGRTPTARTPLEYVILFC